MLMPREIELAKRTQVSVEEVEKAIVGDYSKAKPAVRNAFMGGVAGIGLGVLGGVGLSAGVLPNAEMIAAMGPTVPAMMGLCMAGVGAIAGSFVDLSPILNVWRKR